MCALITLQSLRSTLSLITVGTVCRNEPVATVATVATAKDPKACKYTEEGTLVHEMMQRVYKSDRRMAALADLEVPLSPADKEAILSTIKAKAAEKGIDAASLKIELPAAVTPAA